MFMPMKKGGIFKITYEKHDTGYHVHVVKRGNREIIEGGKGATKGGSGSGGTGAGAATVASGSIGINNISLSTIKGGTRFRGSGGKGQSLLT